MEVLLDLTEEELAKMGLNQLAGRKKLFSHLQHLRLSSTRASFLDAALYYTRHTSAVAHLT